jgi:hypothetical protein
MTSTEFNNLRTKAEKGDRQAILDLALAYSEGDGVAHNDGEFSLGSDDRQWLAKLQFKSAA